MHTKRHAAQHLNHFMLFFLFILTLTALCMPADYSHASSASPSYKLAGVEISLPSGWNITLDGVADGQQSWTAVNQTGMQATFLLEVMSGGLSEDDSSLILNAWSSQGANRDYIESFRELGLVGCYLGQAIYDSESFDAILDYYFFGESSSNLYYITGTGPVAWSSGVLAIAVIGCESDCLFATNALVSELCNAAAFQKAVADVAFLS